MNMKKYIALVLTCVMLFSATISVHAEMMEKDEWYELVEEETNTEMDGTIENTPYGLYIMNVYTTLGKLGSGQLGIRADVMCSSKVAKVRIDFELQKKSGSSWTIVGTNTLYDYNTSNAVKSVSASGLSSGTYRAYVAVLVTDSSGYSESSRSFTDSLTI